ncbi:MAG: hypothetical protein R3B68_05700 [Phycisphaerales bacterium]
MPSTHINRYRSLISGPIVPIAAIGLAVTAALAQPGETLYPRSCNANQCVLAGSTGVMCEVSTDQGCCCKFTGQTGFTCQCVDETTCLTAQNCYGNTEN